MARGSGYLISIDQKGRYAGLLVGQKGRGGMQIVRRRVIPKNPRSDAQQTNRQAFSIGAKVGKRTGMTSTVRTFLKSVVTGANTWLSQLNRSIAMHLSDVKTYVANASNSTVVTAFETEASTLGITAVNAVGSTTIVAITPGTALLAAYVAANDLGFPEAAHPLASVTAGDAATFGATFANV